MQAHRDLSAAQVLGQAVVVVPAVQAAFGLHAMGPLADEGHELQVSRLRRAHEADRASLREEPNGEGRAIRLPDLFVFYMNRLLAALDLALQGLASERLGGGDHVDGNEAELPQDRLVVNPAEGGVVDDRLGSRM